MRKKYYVGWTWTDNYQAFETIARLTEDEADKLRNALNTMEDEAPIAESWVAEFINFAGHSSLEAVVEGLIETLGVYDETGDQKSPSHLRAALAAASEKVGA